MKKMSKVLAVLLAAVTVFAMVGCGSKTSAKAELYQGRKAYVEAGYEGDCVNDVTTSLVLNGDNTYTLVENTSVCQVGGVVVAYWTYTSEGTYKVDSEADGTKTVTLADATSVVYNMNGSITTSDEESSLMDAGKGKTVTLDTTINLINE